MLIQAKDQHTPISAWKFVNHKKITILLKLKSVSLGDGEFIIVPEKIGDDQQLGALIDSKDKILSFFIGDGETIFQAEFLRKLLNGDYIFKAPAMVAIQDRRSSLRLILEDKHDVSVSFLKIHHRNIQMQHKFQKKCFDISRGGLSFILHEQETRFFSIGESVDNIHLSVDGVLMIIDIKLVNLISIEPDKLNKLLYKSFKACFSIDKITPEHREVIENFVLENIKLDPVVN